MCQRENEYIQRCLNGDPESYRHLVRKHQNTIRSYLTGRLGDHHMAEEVTQEVFVRAYFSLGTLKNGKSFLPWLIGIAIRAGQEYIRSRKRVPTAGDMLDAPAPVAQHHPENEPLIRAISRLPANQQEAILLRFHAGLSCVEMSEHLGIPLGSVTKRLSGTMLIVTWKAMKNKFLPNLPGSNSAYCG